MTKQGGIYRDEYEYRYRACLWLSYRHGSRCRACVRSRGHVSVTGSRLRWSAVISVIGFIALATVRELLLHARFSSRPSFSIPLPLRIARVRKTCIRICHQILADRLSFQALKRNWNIFILREMSMISSRWVRPIEKSPKENKRCSVQLLIYFFFLIWQNQSENWWNLIFSKFHDKFYFLKFLKKWVKRFAKFFNWYRWFRKSRHLTAVILDTFLIKEDASCCVKRHLYRWGNFFIR